jgi:2-aminoethylphosphonate-pyruvate transaminase
MATVEIEIPENPYLLLTPGPLTTSPTVKAVMLQDWCTWDDDYHRVVQQIRSELVSLATASDEYTTVLMQGSGTFSVEATLTTAVPRDGKLLVLANGAYGYRMATIARCCGILASMQTSGETNPPDVSLLDKILATDPDITHVAAVHCETTTGMLNPIAEIGSAVKRHGKIYIVDAMSSFGGMPMDVARIGADYLVSSANKCVQGVPGFGFVIARRSVLEQTKGNACSLSLDLYDQWQTMETQSGKWRFTSPTHTVRAFARALLELRAEGGVQTRHQRYCENHRILVSGMQALGFKVLLPAAYQSPIITAFSTPTHPAYRFSRFYKNLKAEGYVIYPGKVTDMDTFRIGNIGHVYPSDIRRLLKAVERSIFWH